MTITLPETLESIVPTPADAALARDSVRRLAECLAVAPEAPLRVRIEPENQPKQSITIPIAALRLLHGVLDEMARGNAVKLVPIHAELTTSEAAELLNVSRPFLIEQLEKGRIPFRKVGSHRRVAMSDVLEYRQTMDRNRLKALEELSEIDQSLGLGY